MLLVICDTVNNADDQDRDIIGVFIEVFWIYLGFVMMFELTTESVTQESDAYRKLVSFGHIVSARRLVDNSAPFAIFIFHICAVGP